MIRAEHIRKSFGEKRVLNDFSASFEAGAAYAITGPSGIGKTTLLRLLAGLEKPEAGRIVTDVIPAPRIRFVFQEDRLLPRESVLANVMLEKGEKERALALLKELNMEGEAGAYPGALSGGMRRRVAIARALCAAPDILLLDEPFNGLDEALKEKAAPLIFREMQGKTLILATHETAVLTPYDVQTIRLG